MPRSFSIFLGFMAPDQLPFQQHHRSSAGKKLIWLLTNRTSSSCWLLKCAGTQPLLDGLMVISPCLLLKFITEVGSCCCCAADTQPTREWGEPSQWPGMLVREAVAQGGAPMMVSPQLWPTGPENRLLEPGCWMKTQPLPTHLLLSTQWLLLTCVPPMAAVREELGSRLVPPRDSCEESAGQASSTMARDYKKNS